MGLHTRIDGRIERVTELAEIGNLYVNRNQIGAVVGVQPFGGDRLSGTGPKAGGPLYMKRLSRRATPHDAGTRNTPTQELELGRAVMKTISLPGPTGEENKLSFHPRGVLAIIPNSDNALLKRQIFRTIATGNQALILAPNLDEEQRERFLQELLNSGAPINLIRFSTHRNIHDLINEKIHDSCRRKCEPPRDVTHPIPVVTAPKTRCI